MSTNSSSLPNGGSRLTLFVLLILLVLILVYYFCCRDKGSLIVERGPIKAPHGISFIDVNGANSNVQKVKVTLIDPDQMVVSSNGVSFNSVEVTGGVMSIGLSSKASFSIEKPYRFFIKAEAEGYITNLRSVVVTEDAPNFIPVYMTNMDKLPSSGLAATFATITEVKSGVLQKTDTLKAVPRWGQVPPLSIVIKEGTKLYHDGKPIQGQGPLSYRLLYGAPRDSNANRVFPGGFEVTDAMDESGKTIADPANPLFFTTAGWISMEMNVGNEEVNSFSEPLLVEMPIADTIINPETQEVLKSGDKIPLWSLDNRTGVWTSESVVSVSAGADGVLRASFPIKHLSTWNLDYKGPRCLQTIDIAYRAPFVGQHFTRLFDVSSPTTGIEISSHLIDFDPVVAPATEETFHLVRTPANGTYNLVVHTGLDASSIILGTSDNFGCADNLNKHLNLFNTPSGNCVNLEFVNSGGAAVLCRNSFWHKTGIATLFTFGGMIDAGQLRLASGLGPQSISLWFYDPATSAQALLTFDINFGMVPGSVTVPFTYTVGGTAVPIPAGTTIGIARTVTAPPATCPASTFTITIPNIVVSGTCPAGVINKDPGR